MHNNQKYAQFESARPAIPNQWDIIVFVLIFGAIAATTWGFKQMVAPFTLDDPIVISLDPAMLPSYATRSVLRMFIAMIFSILFTFIMGTLAAKNKRAERIIIPFIDIMQSIPILGFLSIAVLFFLPLFPNSLLGPECAAILVIFTSQVWNMTLGFYQSIRLLPTDLKEASMMLKLGGWQSFWRVEVPFATPTLLWNMMISMSAGWFYVVASEAISVSNQHIHLPGIGSYINQAVQVGDTAAILYAIIAMLIVILAYDQLFFRPLLAWTSKFNAEITSTTEEEAWFLNWLQQTRLLKIGFGFMEILKDSFVNGIGQSARLLPNWQVPSFRKAFSWTSLFIYYVGGTLAIALSSGFFLYFILTELTYMEVLKVLYYGLVTGIKVAIAVTISSLIWVPIGVWLGGRPKIARLAQTIAQFCASFPANLLYPLIFALILYYQMNINYWVVPLMMLGTQWYILFNVIAAMSMIPRELQLVSDNFGVKGWLKWKRFILPSIMPYYVTGAMAAAGGCWNASIVAEIIESKGEVIQATGLGAYIFDSALIGDFPRLTLGIGVMCIYVMVLNRLIWHRLYELTESRYKMDNTNA